MKHWVKLQILKNEIIFNKIIDFYLDKIYTNLITLVFNIFDMCKNNYNYIIEIEKQYKKLKAKK